MTFEEAGEIILSGDSLEDCPQCKGVGFLSTETETKNHYSEQGDIIMTETRLKTCTHCRGMMQLVRREYNEARVVLGMEEVFKWAVRSRS